MSRRALVTGGAGFIGSRLAHELVAANVEVVVLDDLSVGQRGRVPATAEFLEGDVRDPAVVGQALRGVDIVFHQAARVSVRASIADFYDDADTNLMGTLNLLRACAGSAVRKLVYASSMAVYADSPTPAPITEEHTTEPLSPYGISKLAGEKYCLQFARDAGVDCHVLRYFNTYGPGQTHTPYVGVITIFCHRLLRGQIPAIYGDGGQERDFVYVGDIVAANLASMRSDAPSGIFNVGTGVATSVNAIATLLRQRIAPEIEPEHVPAHAGELRYSIADSTALGAALGFRPAVRLEDKIHEVIDHCRQTADLDRRPGSTPR